MSVFEPLAVQYMAKLIADFGLTDFQAAGVVGNGGTESGGFTQIQEIGPTSGRGGLGHFQWTGPRRRDFEAWLARNADKNWQPDTFDANYSMLYRELVGPESHAIPALKAARTLEQATEAFMNKFERPGVPHLENRISWARKALAAYAAAGSPVAVQPPPAQEPPPSTDLVLPQPKKRAGAQAQTINDILPTLIRILTLLQALMSRMGDVSTLVSQTAAKPAPAPPPSKVEPAAVAVGIGSFFTGLFSQLHGTVGPPEGLDSIINLATSPTVAGTLTTLIPLATTALGLTGGWGALAAGAMKIIGPAIMSAAEARKKQGNP